MSGTAQEYIRRITAHVEGRQPIAVQAASPEALHRLISGASAAALRTRPVADRWSAVEILAHLADAEMVTGFRLRWILGAPGSHVAAYDQDAWATTGHYQTRDPRQSVELFRVLRQANLALLDSLAPEQWKEFGIHSERGQETIEQIVRMTAGHDVNHIRQIEQLLSGSRS